MALALGCLIEKWPWPWGACWGRCLEGLEGFGGFGGFGGFWRVFGGCLEGVWRIWRILERLEGFGGFGVFAGWQTAALKAHRKPLLWPWPWGACSGSGLGPGVGACWGSGLGPGVPAGQGVWRVWTVLESARRVWRVLEGLEGFGGWSDRTSSTPAVVPGAAPALAKAGVGGFNSSPSKIHPFLIGKPR